METALNLATLAEDALQRHGERKTVVFEGETITNAQTLERACRFQTGFQNLGIGTGDIVGMCMINHPYVYGVFQGGYRTGATMAPMMFQLTPTELNYIVGHTEAKAVITDTMLVDKVREAVVGLDHVKHIIVLGGENDPDASPPELRLDDFLDLDQENTISRIDPAEDVALMLYTSGTTGKPKGVMLTHANLIASATAAQDANELHIRNHPIISISALPMAHIFGVGVMNGGYLTPQDIEAGYIVQEVWFDPVRMMTLIDEHKVTDLPCVPTMLSMIVNHPDADQYNLRSIDVVSVGAAPVPEELSRLVTERFGCRVRQIYGMTENAGMGSADRVSKPYRQGSAGPAYKGMKLRIVNDDAQDVPSGERGEIVTQGPSTMKGYFKQPDVTADTIRDGWLYTGDIGYLDEDGYLYIVDRKKDMIIKGGENIFPAEIESVLYEHANVAEAAVIGVPHDKWGEDVVAYVVKNSNGEVTADELIGLVKSKVNKFKAPSAIFFIHHLPKSGVGKILRRELRDQYAADHQS